MADSTDVGPFARPTPISGTSRTGRDSLGGGGAGGRPRHGATDAYEEAQGGGGHGHIVDEASVLGIPAHGLTEAQRAALGQLVGEMERLRWQLQQSEGRQAYLEDLADRHAFLPLINHRAFLRKLAWAIDQVEQQAFEAALLYVYVAPFEMIRLRHGIHAAEAALTHVARVLQANVRSSDIVGSLGGPALGVILTLTDAEAVKDKAGLLVRRMANSDFVWRGQTIGVPVFTGLRALASGDTPNGAVAGADQAMRGHLLATEDLVPQRHSWPAEWLEGEG
ncbi:GGDEF domain-containing protein [Roseospirillum parvum]|uniref:Diguanylate cyclase (GGDEF) domain-containing protein n=1 Tax=Roseospirillum parvum TaxID=83401 RepID=A0A1G7UY89_9PROT|nr:GGDEF domain-containing protein [Roseospirillum parvum]SDG52575.1 diguanylate cyclase (GGDEF) domain-containing protein [Roseospirillum parvum]